MKKAFLCHSSRDKEYARIVARKLSRGRVKFDELSFFPGVDFRRSIRSHLGESALFVFLASRNALDSIWCRFELDLAELKRMEGGIEGQLVIFVDTTIGYSDLPPWLQGAKAVIQTRPSQAARDIQQSLIALLPLDARRPLVGREEYLSQFRERFVPTEETLPHLLIARGLTGVGRRSVLERAIADTLDLNLGPFFSIDRTTTPEDFFLFLSDEVREVESRTALADDLAAFTRLKDNEKSVELAGLLGELCDLPTAPCLIDEGGMLTASGAYQEPWQQVLSRFLERKHDHYLALLHTRRPRPVSTYEDEFFELSIAPLSDGHTRLLLTQLFKRARISAPPSQLVELAEYVDGYPPAAAFATALAQQYGVDILLADKHDLSQFKASRFSRFFSEIELPEDQWMVLVYLGNEKGLPFEALAVALKFEEKRLAQALIGLIDLSLVQARFNLYLVAAPAIQSLYQVREFPRSQFYALVLERLGEAYWDDERQAPPLPVIDATLNAAARSGARQDPATIPFIRASTIHRAAVESYHRADYEAALGFALRGKEVLASGNQSRDRELREIAYKSLVRLKRWSEADAELKLIEQAGDRHFFFLDGFGSRVRGNLADALASFQSARDSGDTRMPVYREIAFCSYGLGYNQDALSACKQALERDGQNLFLLDLLVSIYIALEEYGSAEAALEQLRVADVMARFIHHRRASYLFRTGQYGEALQEAERAIEVGRARFEAYAQRVHILIEAGRFEDAHEAVEELVKKFPRDKHDVVVGLRCKSLVRQGRWREAYNLWQQLEDKHKPVHQGLLRSILFTKSKDFAVPLAERQGAERRANEISAELEELTETLISVDEDNGA